LPPAAARSVAVPPAAGRPAAAPPATGTRPAVEPKPEAKAAKGKFLLQLNGFQDRKEADAFARRLGGQSAHVVPLEVPGKGTLYRVRVGSYGSLQEATTAKAAFEREHNVIAYVAGTGPAR
jgi:cell division septation protein DedD